MEGPTSWGRLKWKYVINAGAQKRNLSKGMVGSRSKWKDDIRSLIQHMDELLNNRAYIWRPKSESLKFAEFWFSAFIYNQRLLSVGLVLGLTEKGFYIVKLSIHFFISSLAAPRPTFGHCWGGHLMYPMLIIIPFLYFLTERLPGSL